ncbi:uncharacterized protein FIBRA_08484 [Fibroporia radiculosa]|uniref:Nephrocystin 3-like N-terminal domain-containing protein n=1 Tax=Fibroporia radiculosa TaxID=599839 RepID=J4I2U2_9APHY|nr:uncharacterized protein FIBRA_08484 [Fibroporia radiculosa]CCM06237.1 predicted protein [Fibroporia radiculosa]
MAGKGKSAIAHTIATWSHAHGELGSRYCFDRTRQADRRHEKIWSTIARDLADHDPFIRRELARIVLHDTSELRHTEAVSRQWERLLTVLNNVASMDKPGPVLIIIDALDESGECETRELILDLLSGKRDGASLRTTKLPPNIRILITSRPLSDIHDALHDLPRVQHVSWDDDAFLESTQRDIKTYINGKLGHQDAFGDSDVTELARKSGGHFDIS